MIHLAIHRLDNGEILQLSSVDGMTTGEVLARWPVTEGQAIAFLAEPLSDTRTHLIVGGEAVPRTPIAPEVSKASIAADGEDLCVITGLPEGCVVMLTGVLRHGPFTLEGGTLELSTTEPGEITVQVSKSPTHISWETTIHAH